MTGGAECFVAGSAEGFVTGVAEYFVAEVAECFVGTFLVVLSAYHHPNLPQGLHHSCKWGNVVPMNTFLQLVLA